MHEAGGSSPEMVIIRISENNQLRILLLMATVDAGE